MFKKLMFGVLAMFVFAHSAFALSFVEVKSDTTNRIGAPIETDWYELIADGETATTDAYDPFNATGVSGISMRGYTGIQIRAKFTAAMGTDPIIACFGRKGTDWAILRDENGSTEISLSDDATIENNTNDDTSYWTDPSTKIDALGADAVVCTVATAGVSASGTISIEAARY